MLNSGDFFIVFTFLSHEGIPDWGIINESINGEEKFGF